MKCIALTEDREEGDPGARVVKMLILQRAESKKCTGLNCFFEDGEVLRSSRASQALSRSTQDPLKRSYPNTSPGGSAQLCTSI